MKDLWFPITIAIIITSAFMILAYNDDVINEKMKNAKIEYFIKSEGLNNSEKYELALSLCDNVTSKFEKNVWTAHGSFTKSNSSCAIELMK